MFNKTYKVLYGIAIAAIVTGSLIGTAASRQSAYSESPTSDTVSNTTTLLTGLGGLTGIIGAITQVIGVIRGARGGEVDNQPHQAIFSAILAAMDVAAGKAAETKGSQTLGNGTLTWDVKFVPSVTGPVTG